MEVNINNSEANLVGSRFHPTSEEVGFPANDRNSQKTTILFRKDRKTKIVVAVLPERLSFIGSEFKVPPMGGDACVGYFIDKDVFRHGVIENIPALMKQSDTARGFEYIELREKIEELGYVLDIKRNYSKTMRDKRR